MEGGDLDHPITIQGDDELALLATSLDGLRRPCASSRPRRLRLPPRSRV